MYEMQQKKKIIKSRVSISIKTVKTILPNNIIYVLNVENMTNTNITNLDLNIKYVGNIIPLSKSIWNIKNNNCMKLNTPINLKRFGNIDFYFSADKNTYSQLIVNNKFICTNLIRN